MSGHRGADRAWLGAGLGLAGAVMLFLGWFGASGANTVAEQVPYLASGSIPGAALVVAAAIVFARDSAQRADRRTDALIADLHALLVEAAPSAPIDVEPAVMDAAPQFVAVEGSQRFHRPDCALAANKPSAKAVDAATIAQRGLSPCEICAPQAPGA